MARIIDYSTETKPISGDYFLVDNESSGTKKVPADDIVMKSDVDSTPTQGSSNAVSSGGVYSALQAVKAEIPDVDPTLTQSGQAADAKVVGDEIADLKEDLNAVSIKNTASGSIANLADNIGIAFTAFTANIAYKADGWTGATLSGCGTNIWNEEWEVGGIATSTGANAIATDKIRSANYIPCVGNTSYCFLLPWAYIFYYDADYQFIRYDGNGVTEDGGVHAVVKTTPEQAKYMRFRCSGTYGASYNNNISINYPSTDTAYHAYVGDTVTVNFGKTIYGGSLNVLTGVLTSTLAADGTELAEPVAYQLTALDVSEMYDTQYIYADTGDVTVQYSIDTKTYTDNAIAAADATVDLKKIKDFYVPTPNNAPTTKGLKAVIFGDSITETASMNDDGTNYVEGTRHNWPEYATDYLELGSFKNYAKTGARYQDNPDGSYRQSVSNQIALAVADSSNDDADIVIFSLGTNDPTTNLGSYSTAMSKATLNDLDRAVLYEAIRYAFWKVHTKYKNAVCFAALPIQRMAYETPTVLLTAITEMAHRYNFIIIDANAQSGIIRENNIVGGEGNDLVDGLHPNTTGQIKMARLYASVIMEHYLWR